MNDSVIDTFTQKLSIKATEYTDDFIFEVINHYCEEVSKIKVSKEYLRQVLTKSVPLSVIEDIKADIRAIEMEGPIDDRAMVRMTDIVSWLWSVAVLAPLKRGASSC